MGRISSRFGNSKVTVITQSDKTPASLGLAGMVLMEELLMTFPLCFHLSESSAQSQCCTGGSFEQLRGAGSVPAGNCCSVARINAPHPTVAGMAQSDPLSLWAPGSAHFAQLLSLASSWHCLFPASLLCKPGPGQSQGEMMLDPGGAEGCAAA